MDNQDQIIKHLEFIQATISRMGSNSLVVKGWCITLVAGIFVIEPQKLILILAVLILFWLLDAFYMYMERGYRQLYDEVRIKGRTDFSMKPREKSLCDFFSDGMFTITVWPLYFPLVGVIIYLLFNQSVFEGLFNEVCIK